MLALTLVCTGTSVFVSSALQEDENAIYHLSGILKSLALEGEKNTTVVQKGALENLETWTDYCFSKIPEGLFIDYSNEKQVKTYGVAFAFKKEITELASAVLDKMKEQMLAGKWYQDKKLSEAAWNKGTLDYVLMKNLPPKAKICAIGDIHGTIHPLLRLLWKLVASGYLDSDFKIIDPSFYLVFLGDFIDRGSFGLEVLYTLLRVMQANQNTDRVIVLRGNHEDEKNYHSPFYQYQFSFGFELKKRFLKDSGKNNDWSEDIFGKFFEKLPTGLFVTCNDFVLQFCHGGAMFTTPDNLSALDNIWRCTEDCYRLIPKTDDPMNSLSFWLTWGDFNVSNQIGIDGGSGRPFVGSGKVEAIGKKQKISAFIRGHQHYSYTLKLLPHYGAELTGEKEPIWWQQVIKPENRTDYLLHGFPLESTEYLPIFTLSTAGGLCAYQGFGIVSLEKEFKDCRLHLYEKKILATSDLEQKKSLTGTLTERLLALGKHPIAYDQNPELGGYLYTGIVCDKKAKKVGVSWHENPVEKPVVVK